MNSAEIEALDDAALGKLADETLVAGVDVDINGEAWTGRACEVICARNERIRRAAKKKRDEEEAPGPDDYRTPPGAPTIAGCPVEEMPAAGTRIRVWRARHSASCSAEYAHHGGFLGNRYSGQFWLQRIRRLIRLQ